MRVLATAVLHSAQLEALKRERPIVWRSVRRFNLPIQLAVAAALEVSEKADNPSEATLISITPCQNGSPAVYQWARQVAYEPCEQNARLRVNPTHTLHGVDNLALSAMSIALQNHRPGIGLGGSAGQAWEGLEMSLREDGDQVILFAGDQESSLQEGPALGVAMLLSKSGSGHSTIDGVRWEAAKVNRPRPHSARGLAALVDVLEGETGAFTHHVDDADGDGICRIVVEGAIE